MVAENVKENQSFLDISGESNQFNEWACFVGLLLPRSAVSISGTNFGASEILSKFFFFKKYWVEKGALLCNNALAL